MDVNLPMLSVPITTSIVSLIHEEVISIRFHVIKFVSDLLHGEVNSMRFHVVKCVGDFLHG